MYNNSTECLIDKTKTYILVRFKGSVFQAGKGTTWDFVFQAGKGTTWDFVFQAGKGTTWDFGFNPAFNVMKGWCIYL